MDSRLIQNLKNLRQLNRQRVYWLKLNIIIIIFILISIFNWDYIRSSYSISVIYTIGIIISVVWWYWPIIAIRKLINFKSVETELLYEIINDIKEIKKDIQKKLNTNS